MKWYMNKRKFLGIIAVVFFFVIGETLAQSITFEEAVRESVKARYAGMPGFTGKVIVNAGESGLNREGTGHPMLAPAAFELRESPAGGNFLALDGIADYARINSVPELQLNETNNPTIEAWVYFNSLTVVCDGWVVFAFVEIGHPPSDVGASKLWIDLNGLGELCDGLVVFVVEIIGFSPFAMVSGGGFVFASCDQ